METEYCLIIQIHRVSYTGIPLIYSGDEIGQLNDWGYKDDADRSGDSRWHPLSYRKS